MKSDEFEAIGKAAMAAGLDHAIRILTEQRDLYRAEALALLPGGGPGKRKGRPPKANGAISANGKPINPNSYWGRMTPEERKAESARRQLVAEGKAPTAQQGYRGARYNRLHDRKAARSAQQSRANTSWWSKATPAQRKKRLAALAAGRNKLNGAAVEA